jgi:hypothetical protein
VNGRKPSQLKPVLGRPVERPEGRRMNKLSSVILVALFVLVAKTSRPESLTDSPIGPLPDGWVWLPSEGIDSWMATFHDKVSGACVSMDAAWPSVVRPIAAQGAEVGTANGVRYHRRRDAKAKCRGGDAIELSFFPPSQTPEPLVWNFSADLCQASQRDRAEELLLRKGRIGSGAPPSRRGTRLPTPEEVTGLAAGTSVVDVAKLGLPGDSSCVDGGGFTVGYAVTHGKSYRQWDLRFDARQGFVSAKRRHPGY